MSSSDVCEKFPPAACSIEDGKINPIVDFTDPNLPIWGKQGEWVFYKQYENTQKELEETKRKLAAAEAELAARKQDDYAAVKAELERLKGVLAGKGNLMAAGLKACADVTFTPKTP
jgi:hypothetical protein